MSVNIPKGEKPEEIEVTDEMIEVGFAALAKECLADALLEADRMAVARIYRAMHEHEPKHPHHDNEKSAK